MRTMFTSGCCSVSVSERTWQPARKRTPSTPYSRAHSAGHSAASWAELQGALQEGLRCFTHLFNAMSPLTAREPGVTGAALDSGGKRTQPWRNQAGRKQQWHRTARP
jgi:hypothetical protein